MDIPNNRQLAAMLYRVRFPNKLFANLDPDVQDAYVEDAKALRKMMDEFWTAARQ